jgi:hypothetical protein
VILAPITEDTAALKDHLDEPARPVQNVNVETTTGTALFVKHDRSSVVAKYTQEVAALIGTLREDPIQWENPGVLAGVCGVSLRERLGGARARVHDDRKLKTRL